MNNQTKFVKRRGDRALARLAARQHAVFHLHQAASAGVPAEQLRYRISALRLHRIHQGVYGFVPEALLTPNGRRMAAVLACGPGAVLSHHSAVKLRGLRDHSHLRIDVTVPTSGGRSRPGIQIHRSPGLRRDDLELVQGIPCTTVARTIFDMAGELSPRGLERLLDEASYREVLDVRALEEQIRHNPGRKRACSRLRNALVEHRPGSTITDGPAGEEMLTIIRSTGLPAPKVQHWIDLGDGEPMIQADFAWPEARVILETDGQRAHGRAIRTRADYRRDQRAALAGWYTLRVATQQIRSEPERIRATLVEVVSERLARRGAHPASSSSRAARRPVRARAAPQ